MPSQARSGMAFLMKDLTSLGRPLESLLIVDNTPTVRCCFLAGTPATHGLCSNFSFHRQ